MGCIKFSGTLRYRILARRSDLILINKKIKACCPVDFPNPGGPQSGNKRKQKDRRVLGAGWRTKKVAEQIVVGMLGTSPKVWEKD